MPTWITELEEQGGNTIFSKQATLEMDDTNYHRCSRTRDFSAEMERTIQVMDYAILVINGAEGVQGHTKTLWHCGIYKIPVLFFCKKWINKRIEKEDLLIEVKAIGRWMC